MRRLDALVIKELIGPWVFGVGLFTSLLLAVTYLNSLTEFIADGVPGSLILQLFGLLMPAILVKTFSMAVLLASLLSFGRLSSDSEVVAMRAGGASVTRIVLPVAVFSLGIAMVTFLFNEQVVPFAATRAKQLQEQILRSKDIRLAQPIAKTLIEKNKLRAAIVAKNINPSTQVLEGVTMVLYDSAGAETALMMAKQLEFKSEDDWRVQGGARIVTLGKDRSDVTLQDGLWPEQLPKIGLSFREITAARDDDFDSMTMAQLRISIQRHWEKRDKTLATLANYEYGYWTKLSVPLAAIIFGTLGSVLGIRNHRTGTAAGFALAVGIIFGYVTLANFMNVWATKGVLPAWVAAFMPLIIGTFATGIILWRRNQ